jgi:hypothetical protein
LGQSAIFRCTRLPMGTSRVSELLAAEACGRCCRTRRLVGTPFQNPAEGGVIEVTDPTHPLFGRRFALVSGPGPNASGGGHVLVAFRNHILLRLPSAATSLASRPSGGMASKLTIEAMRELVTLTDNSGVEACSSDPSASGSVSPRRCDATSLTSLPRSSRR